MPYTQNEMDRAVALLRQIEDGKEHEHAAPTYQDSPALSELAELVHSHLDDNDAETLENSIAILAYLTDSYDRMCRTGLSVKFYTQLLSCHARLMNLRSYNQEEAENIEGAFYHAVRARNRYQQDDCGDLMMLLAGYVPDERMREIRQSAMEDSRSIKYDPVELTDAYLAVIDEVEACIDRDKTMDFCLEYWSLKRSLLSARGINWRSPVELNPGVMFD